MSLRSLVCRSTMAASMLFLVPGALLSGVAFAGPPAKDGPAKDAPAKDAKAAPKSDATGKLKLEEFETALRPLLQEMHECYRKALKKDAIAEGDVVLIIETAGGKVLKAETDKAASSLKLDDAHKCIVSVLKKAKMPIAKNAKGEHDPKAKAAVRYPVEFSLGIDVGTGPSKASGAKLDHDKVKNVFFVNKIEFGRCILDARKANKGQTAAGKLVLEVNVTGGKVTTAKPLPETTVEDKEFKDCIVEAVKKFKFPLAKDAKGVDDEKAASTITYPMEFSP